MQSSRRVQVSGKMQVFFPAGLDQAWHTFAGPQSRSRRVSPRSLLLHMSTMHN